MLGLLAGGLAVIGIGAAATSFILGELTEEERRKQQQIINDFDDYKVVKQKELNSILMQYKITEQEFYTSHNEQIAKEREKFINKYKEETEKFKNNIIQKIDEQIESKDLIEHEIKEAINRISRLNESQKSMLRGDALIHLKKELQEAKSKVIAYKHYLKKYKKNLMNIDKIDNEFTLFSFKLPEGYPYIGKLMFIPKNRLIEGKYTELVENKIKISYSFSEKSTIDDVDDNAIVPVMIAEFDFNNYSYILSASKGYLKHLAINQTRIGIEAKVIEHREDRKIILEYKGLNLILNRKNLENPKRTPPCGAILRVYPIKWDYSLYHNVEVSEKYQDSLKAFQFSTLPMVFSEETSKAFIEYINENEIENEVNEWKIGPLNQEDISQSTKIKLQLGDQMVICASLIEGKKPYFKFDRILELEENFKPEDIFVVMEATLTMVNECDIKELEEDNFINLENLKILLFKEFKIQKAIKESSEGMFYFNKWAEITDKLINYLYKGSSILCEVGKCQFKKIDKKSQTPVFEMVIYNNEEVKDYLHKVYDNYQKDFFIELKSGEYINVEFSSRGDKLYLFGDLDSDFQPSMLLVYCKNYCYPEIQQKLALNDFRSGRLSNSILQSYVLNGANIESKKINVDIEKFYNERLASNEAQKNSVIGALEEENIFLIQGPPGTGKTTVIREIIRQQLKTSPYSRILIVSQANVAIDNVLKGMDNEIKQTMIRCGHMDKIDDILYDISFDYKYNTYISKILDKNEDTYTKEILVKWKSIIDAENKKYNSNIGELLLRKHQIVGATCIGLMQRQIGLDRVEFDLVIIDEAGKALPAELLIPLNRAKKVILIGDHKQLPPVVNPALLDSDKIELDDKEYCNEELFSKSLFKRLYENSPETNKSMLTIQYRMPAVIGTMISECFYEGNLRNGDSTYNKKPLYFNKNLNFLDMSNDIEFYEETINNKSVVNQKEANVVLDVINEIREKISKDKKIAVICPYKGQKRLILRILRNNGINLSELNVAVNTIDAYQGDEAEIVIYCTTRAKKPTKYFSDLARLNVAFSRAKNDLLIIGSIKYFNKYGKEHILSKIADYIIKNGEIINYAKCKFYNKVNKVNHNNFIHINNEKKNKLNTKGASAKYVVKLEQIKIKDDFLKTPPKRYKIDRFIEEYKKNNCFSKSIILNKNSEVIDGYARYLAALELGVKEIEVEFLQC